MNILWISGTIFPAPAKALGMPAPLFGGWMYHLGEKLGLSENLAVASSYNGRELKKYVIDNVVYYLLPSKSATKYNKALEPIWKIITQEFKPDVIHIHGTEFAPGLACMRACYSYNFVVSIQGLIGVIARYYLGGINHIEVARSITFRDIVKRDTLFQAKKKFQKRGVIENEYITRTHHIIGRTSWDYAHTKAINPKVNYHFCNESLRKLFYDSEKWDIQKKKEYSIFISQATYPYKGFHQVLRAVSVLKNEFPSIRVRVAGHPVINSNKGLKSKIRISGYGVYLLRLIQKLGIRDNIEFTGALSEQQMITEFKDAHLFICPSSIENSSNSLGEAQLLGVPAIASYAGGTPDMIIHNQTGLLYRFEDTEMLAEHIRNLFANDLLAAELSANEIKEAEKRHHLSANLQQLLHIYNRTMKD